MERRNFMRGLLAGGAAAAAPATALAAGAGAAAAGAPGGDRAYMAGLLQKMADPVLASMSKGS